MPPRPCCVILTRACGVCAPAVVFIVDLHPGTALVWVTAYDMVSDRSHQLRTNWSSFVFLCIASSRRDDGPGAGLVQDEAFHGVEIAVPGRPLQHLHRVAVPGVPAVGDAAGAEIDVLG